MTEQDILRLRDLAEAGQVQFKERIVSKDDKYEIGCEMVAFSNSRGGRLILLPYTGAGSGVRRALEYDPDVVFSNGVDQREITHSANEFVITIPRKPEQTTDPANDQASSKTDPVRRKTDPVNDQAPQNTTKLAHNIDPVSDQAPQNTTKLAHNIDPVSDQAPQNTTKLAHNIDPVSDQAPQNTTKLAHNTDLVIDQAHKNTTKFKLSKKQQDIRNFCSIPRTGKEILQRAGVADHFDSRKRYIYDLVEAGVLERTIPDKPNDPNQKYRRKQ